MVPQKINTVLVAIALMLALTACGGMSGTPPTITAQPQDQTVPAGAQANFSVNASGSVPLHYQWMLNGMAISGATSSNYVTPAVMLTDNNEQFSVVVSNSSGSVTSNSATLHVLAVP